MDVFFTGKRDTFFAPLNGKYREAILQGLKELYLRLNGPRADFEYLISRDDVLQKIIPNRLKTKKPLIII